MKKMIAATGALILSATVAPASGHHSAAEFDFRDTTAVSGKVVSTRFANPHMRLILEVTDEERGRREIEFEGHSRNNMRRQGLLPDMFEVGDTITISIAPMRDGSDGGYVVGVRTPDGETIGNIRGAD
jgi:hypothetical protein